MNAPLRLGEGPAALEARLPEQEAARLAARLEILDRGRFAAHLWQREPTLWGPDPAHVEVAGNRLGWVGAPAGFSAGSAEALRGFAREVAAEGFTRAVLLGMGGSSLAPEVLRLTLGVGPGSLDLEVLDNTSPAAVRAAALTHPLERTLFVVSSKSGGTIEVASFEKHFFERVSAVRGTRAGRAFVAITDPGTPLAALAAERGYRRVFTNPPDIGGRYSALSLFGLVPAALIGADLEALAAEARAEWAAFEGPAVRHPGLALGAALGELALAGRDKLTLVHGPGLEALGSWIEQLVAESTGKNGRGIVPVDGERLGRHECYGRDRVFVATSLGPLEPETRARLDTLVEAGHPVLSWELARPEAIAGAFVRWEVATVTAAAALGVDPFDEPNVTEAKEATRAVLARWMEDGAFGEGAPLAAGGGVGIEAPKAVEDLLRPALEGRDEPAAWISALLSLAHPGDYVALLAYLHRTSARHERLQRLRMAARTASLAATTLGYGPRFLHSTGQLHKGGPATGVFLQLLADESPDEPIPGERYGFAALRAAQAAGDYEVLAARGRRVLRVHLGADVEGALDGLLDALAVGTRG